MFKRKTKQIIKIISATTLACFVLLLPIIALGEQGVPDPEIDKVDKGGFSGWLGGAFLSAIALLLYGILKLFSYLLAVALKILNIIISGDLFRDIFFSENSLVALDAGWSAVRDFLNMFFILILIFIAISIILGVSKYADKKNVIKVIGAALLINFSKAITLFIIDVSQLAMQFFANAIQVNNRSFGGLIAENMGIANIFELDFYEGTGFLVVLLMSIIFVFILTCMIVTLTITLIIRLVAFWVLLILSPIAMFGLAVPGSVGNKLTGTWFQKLMSWAFFGPIMLFFLWISLVVVSAIASTYNMSGSFQMKTSINADQGGNFLTTIGATLVPFMAGIYLLYYGFDLSKKISEGFATTILDKGKDWTNKTLKTSGKLVASGLTGGLASKAGMEGLTERYENSALGRNRFTRLATEKGRKRSAEDVKGRFSGKKGKQSAERKRVNEELKKFKDENFSDNKIKGLLTDENATKESKTAAALYLAKNGKLNDKKDKDGVLLYEEANKLIEGAKDQSIKDNFEKDSKEKNSFGRYLHNKKIKEEEVRKEGVLTREGDIKKEASRRAGKEIAKELQKKNLEDVMKQDAKLLRKKSILKSIEDKHGRDALENVLRQGKLTGEKAEIIKNHLSSRSTRSSAGGWTSSST